MFLPGNHSTVDWTHSKLWASLNFSSLRDGCQVFCPSGRTVTETHWFSFSSLTPFSLCLPGSHYYDSNSVDSIVIFWTFNMGFVFFLYLASFTQLVSLIYPRFCMQWCVIISLCWIEFHSIKKWYRYALFNELCSHDLAIERMVAKWNIAYSVYTGTFGQIFFQRKLQLDNCAFIWITLTCSIVTHSNIKLQYRCWTVQSAKTTELCCRRSQHKAA